jgi:3-methyladenine DNA glycosylase Tag
LTVCVGGATIVGSAREQGMKSFDEIHAMAAGRKGGDAALEALLAPFKSKTPEQIAATPDDRILSAMTRQVFQAGFSWKTIDHKWPGFEAAFDGFDLNACAFPSEEKFDALLKDRRIVRNARKILAVQVNARLLLDLAGKAGSAARFIAGWPDSDFVGLLELVKTRAAGLGWESAMRVLRGLGKPAFITSRDVTAALIRDGVLDRPVSGKRDLARVQAAFNAWARQSGRDLTELSRILAMSVDG